MAKKIMRARPVEPCRKCGDPVFGKDWMEMDGLCHPCYSQQETKWKREEQNFDAHIGWGGNEDSKGIPK